MYPNKYVYLWAKIKMDFINEITELHKRLDVLTEEISLLIAFAPESVSVNYMTDERICIINKLRKLL